jgi:hypothetical protein
MWSRGPNLLLGDGTLVELSAQAVTADVYVDDELVQRGVTWLDLALVLRVDKLTQVRVEAPGYEPWQLELRGEAMTDKKMEGPMRMVPVKPSGAEA